ncbi:MAG: redoxin domain-containing protein, partial [Bacteroidota bacterium]|nr:redoxin domain-containing protein [Bacteroidota bacterium]
MEINRMVLIVFLFCSSVCLHAQNNHEEPITLEIGQPAPNFNLKGTDGKMYSLNSFSKAKVLIVVFGANHC